MARRRRRPSVTVDFFHIVFFTVHFFLSLSSVFAITFPDDANAMVTLSNAIGGDSLGWKGNDPCGSKWQYVVCSRDNRVTALQLSNLKLSGTIPSVLTNLTKLSTIYFQGNKFSGELPSFSGLSSLQDLYLDGNAFSSVPAGIFSGLTGLQNLHLDNNPFGPWQIPAELAQSTNLQSFTASKANAVGTIPDFFDKFPNLQILKISYNNLTGGLPASFAATGIQTLWLNNQNGEGLNGSIAVLGQMRFLTQVWLHSNAFSGPIPDLSNCTALFDLQLRDNSLTGIVNTTLFPLSSLQNISLSNNHLQGPYPSFPNTVTKLIGTTNSFCLPQPGDCDQRIVILLSIVANWNYPIDFATSWKGNNPCSGWSFLSCDSNGTITVLSFTKRNLVGTIPPAITNLTGLKTLLLNNNSLTGSIPVSLTTLANLKLVDLSYNNLTGEAPKFNRNVIVNTDGNPYLGGSNPSNGGRSGGNNGGGSSGSTANSGSSSSQMVKTIVIVIAVLIAVLITAAGAYYWSSKQKRWKFRHVGSPPTSANGTEEVKLAVADGYGHTVTEEHSASSSTPNSLPDTGTAVFTIQQLQQVTSNFNKSHEIGRGGFGVVYKGELRDRTKIAVKRMQGAGTGSKGMGEFLAEINVLTKVRHRHLVGLLGYCIERNERILVYEYMPQGTLGQHLFEGPEKGFSFLNWKQRLTIALDVARGVEYLHSLAREIFIHRDLKPSNILLDDSLRAKVADFGLVKLAPDGKFSIETRLAGTFGYLAPEYAATGRVTTKVDVFAFGVILMEMLTGRKALDESQPEESSHLVTWFRRLLISDQGDISKAIDPAISIEDEDTSKSISIVAELAGHCTARESHQRPDMGHVVNTLAPLVDQWKPVGEEDVSEGVSYDIPLSVAIQRWQANDEGTSTMMEPFYRGSIINENTHSSIPQGSACFPESVNCR